MTATATTAPIMPYNPMLDMLDKGDTFLTGENVTAIDMLEPLTVIEPDDGETDNPDTLLTVYE